MKVGKHTSQILLCFVLFFFSFFFLFDYFTLFHPKDDICILYILINFVKIFLPVVFFFVHPGCQLCYIFKKKNVSFQTFQKILISQICEICCFSQKNKSCNNNKNINSHDDSLCNIALFYSLALSLQLQKYIYNIYILNILIYKFALR